jgi:hypothetical protein
MFGYIYLISFDNTNDVYIGKTIQSIKRRFSCHIRDKNSSVSQHLKKNPNINVVYIRIIDGMDMDEDLSFLNGEFNYLNLSNFRLEYLEKFYIDKYKNNKEYNVINKGIYYFNKKCFECLFPKKNDLYYING